MTLSQKYDRTYHFTFSPGTTSDDRINQNYFTDILNIKQIVVTEKLDGENTCLNQFGVFARSHAAPTIHPWANYLKERWVMLKNDLDDLEIFGENLYAIHSIEYQNIEHHFYVFAIREDKHWLSWEEVKFYAAMLDFPVVPEITTMNEPFNQLEFENSILDIIKEESTFGSKDVLTRQKCSMEGVVCRNTSAYSTTDFKNNVFKYVRKSHVKTDVHWTRNWKRAKLMWERT